MPTKEQIEAIIKELQKIMRIQDWDIEVELISGLEMAKKSDGELDTDGLCYRNLKRNYAMISINKEICDDWYYVLVHEMIHIPSTLLIATAEAYFNEKHSYFDIIYEQFTDNLARLFIALYPITNFNHILEATENDNYN
jgi:hypothetical protein